MAPAGKSAVWMLTYQSRGLAALLRAKPTANSTQPATDDRVSGSEAAVVPDGKNGTATGPAAPAAPGWMWEAAGAPIPDHSSRKQALPPPRRTNARPRPSGSPEPGTSLAPLRLAASRVTLPPPAPGPVAAAPGAVSRVSPAARAAASATTATRLRIRKLLVSGMGVGRRSPVQRDTRTTTGRPVRFPC